MKTIATLLFLSITLLFGCKSGTDVMTPDTWSAGCIQLAPYQGGYQLSGICCAYVLLPSLNLASQPLVIADGSYHEFTGAGFGSVPIRVTVSVSADKAILTLSYSTGGTPTVYRLKPGSATVACLCGCD